jgi:hypothetical protein
MKLFLDVIVDANECSFSRLLDNTHADSPYHLRSLAVSTEEHILSFITENKFSAGLFISLQ